MYIKYQNKKYICEKCIIGSEFITYKNLAVDFPQIVSGEIVLFADDGFELRTDNVENYLRQTFENGILTLTNMPETVVDTEEETEQPINPIEQLMADVYYIAIMTGVEL